ncbi:MAG: phosphopantothenoylcysteine decarboxylase, partial [Planctomycetota bacterium]
QVMGKLRGRVEAPKDASKDQLEALAREAVAERLEGKWKKKEEGGEAAALELVENPDLLRTVARDKGTRKVIAFALETADGPRRAAAKLIRKNADWIVLNGASALNARESSVTVLDANGPVWSAEGRPKAETAERLLRLLGLGPEEGPEEGSEEGSEENPEESR